MLALSFLGVLSFVACSAAGLAGCRSSSEKAAGVVYGDAMGVEMKASQGIGGFMLGLAVSHGRDVKLLVAPLSGALHHAVVACPGALSDITPESGVHISFSVQNGTVHRPSVTGSPYNECLTRALEGATIEDKGSFEVLAELRSDHQAAP